MGEPTFYISKEFQLAHWSCIIQYILISSIGQLQVWWLKEKENKSPRILKLLYSSNILIMLKHVQLFIK